MLAESEAKKPMIQSMDSVPAVSLALLRQVVKPTSNKPAIINRNQAILFSLIAAKLGRFTEIFTEIFLTCFYFVEQGFVFFESGQVLQRGSGDLLQRFAG